ncbi:ABC transporter substrate-binding protein [Streptomyces atratus]|uniref:ABC transporter substrate-binding protein n=1 Tax=Streptomyces atratus TaxID=1893 RepID=UPI0021A4CCC6|nr:extracellular solute-binding protein [Streptomyces atratus]MCT2543575.1 extracellular solute-binding protein [Streptomyces atratus]
MMTEPAHRPVGRRTGTRRTGLAAIGAALLMAVSLTACGSGSGEGGSTDGRTEITVAGMPPTTLPAGRKDFLAQVRAFEKANPDIRIKPTDALWDAKTFPARLASGQLETVFRVPLTYPPDMIERHRIADLSKEIKALPHGTEFDKRLLAPVTDSDGKVYGIPTEVYSVGLVYNRELFGRAGLDPDKPPATWEELRTAARTIADRTGVPGFGMHTTDNTGGWMLTTMTYSYGGRMEKEAEGRQVTAFRDGPTGRALALLKAMRWDDGSMGKQQLRGTDDLTRDFAGGKVAMLLGSPSTYGAHVAKFRGRPGVYGQAPLPSEGEKSTLLGGGVAVVSPKADRAQRRAAAKWIDFFYLRPKYDPALAAERTARAAADKNPAGVPGLPFYDAKVSGPATAAEREHSNVPLKNFTPYLNSLGTTRYVVEPPVAAQELYAALDSAVQAVLTRESADPDEELAKADRRIGPALERSQR